jgi:hypothetical protein
VISVPGLAEIEDLAAEDHRGPSSSRVLLATMMTIGSAGTVQSVAG